MTEKHLECPHCKKRFADQNALHQHNRAKHTRKIGKRSRAPDPDYETFADRAIQAELDHAMGIDNPDYDWLVEPYR